MPNVRIGLSLMIEDAFREAALPLFEEGLVDTVVWSFDMGWGRTRPDWLRALIAHYASLGELRGHGVSLSLMSGNWTPRQEAWVERLRQETEQTDYRTVSEHFGFMTAGNFHQGAPLPVPFLPETVELGRARLERIAEVVGIPVGLENLAFAFSKRDAQQQGAFLDALLEPIDGFIVLDVHNLWCQAVNFGLDYGNLLASYPLERVRELHVSGGSWSYPGSDPRKRPFRRDTHDHRVPAPVLDLVERTVARCPCLEAVIVEHLGDALEGAAGAAFADDYRAVTERVGGRA